MNKFRNDLHSVFFFPGSNGNGEMYKHYEETPEVKNEVSEEDVKQEELEQKQAAEVAADERDAELETSKKVISEIVPDATKAQSAMEHMENVFGDGYSSLILNKIYKRRNNGSLDREYVKKIQARLAENVKLGNLWEKNIRAGYKDLLKTLLDNKYFHNPLHESEEEIRRMYTKAVESQYERYVWDIDDKGFEDLKGDLFGKKMKDYPANVVYKNLNKTDIFAREVGNKQAYTVEAQKTENFETNLSSVEAQKWGDKKRFLIRDLPNYLWETKDTSVFAKILRWTPVISQSNERVSEKDKRGIGGFMDAVERISVEGGQKPELALLEAFKDAQTNWTDYQWKERLAEKNIVVKAEKDMRRVIEAGRFYCESQRLDLSVENQHNLYLSILGVIEHEGGIDGAIAQFMDDVNGYKEKKIAEGKKQNEKDGKLLEEKDKELFNMSNRFNKRYTRAVRLSEMNENSFKDRSVVDILSDLNNDGNITYADRGVTKTGLEFKKIVEMIGEKDATNHLIEQAKILNKTMELGLTDDDLKYEEIQKGNKKLILVLQNIISQPGGDLYPLLVYGPNAAKKYKEAFNLLPESADDARVLAAADELLKDINVEDFKHIEGVDQSTDPEGVRQAVAGKLFTEYTRGVGLGGSLSFDQWVKGVSLNGGFQVSESGTGVGLTLAWNPKINLGKGWSITPGGSFGFVPLFHAAVGGSVEVAKEWIDKNSIAERIGVKGGFTRIFGVADIISVSAGWSRDKLAGIEGDRHNIESQFNNQIMAPLMNSIADKLGDDKVLDLEENETTRSKVIEAIEEQVERVLTSEEKSKLKQGDKESLIDNTIRFLSFFDKADLSNEGVRKAIANEMAEEYSYSREDRRLNDIDGETYLSGASIGFSWIQLGKYGVGVIHAGLSFTKHEHDVYGDRSFGRYRMGAEKFRSYSNWDQGLIDDFNKNLPNDKKLSLNEDGYVVIPQNLLRDVYINPGMKQLIKKDKEGNVLLHPETRIDLPVRTIGTVTESVRINVGGVDHGMVRLNEVTNDWFTDSIDPSKLTGKENIFDKERLDKELDKLKANYKQDKDFQNYKFDEEIMSNLENGKKYRIILTKNGQGISTEVEETTEGKGLSIEYNPLDKKALVSKEATIIANNTYAEALKVTSNALYNISHDKNNRLNSEYRTFANAVKDQQYEKAKATILAMLPKMDKYINQYQQKNHKVDFSKVSETLQKLEGAELGKALMSINNVFARVSSVHGGTDGLYHFKMYDSTNKRLVDRDMGGIVEAREKEIGGKIDRSDLSEEVKKAYQGLISFAESYRKNNLDKYSGTKKEAKTLENAIGINLGNAINVENPLFNPEVYADSVVDLKDFDFDWIDVLKKRTLNVVAGNKALMSPILESLGFDENASIDLENAKYENGQLSLDINGKNVILKANMKIALFAQCVNLMLILDDISAEVPGEPRKVEFGPSVMGDGGLLESTLGREDSSSRTRGSAAIGIRGEEEEKKEEKPDYEDGSNPSNGKPGGEDKTQPETDGKPIGETGGETGGNTGGETGGNTGGDDIWTEGGQNGGGSIDHGNDGDL